MKLKIIAAMIIAIFILFFLVGLGASYEIKGDRSLDANCLGYSKEVRDELIEKGEDARLIGFWEKDKIGHCMVVINPYSVDYTIIESYTGREFRFKKMPIYEFDYYLISLLGCYPENIWIEKDKIDLSI